MIETRGQDEVREYEGQEDDPGQRPVDAVEEVDSLGRGTPDKYFRAVGEMHRRDRVVAQDVDEMLRTGTPEVLATDDQDLLVATCRIDEGHRCDRMRQSRLGFFKITFAKANVRAERGARSGAVTATGVDDDLDRRNGAGSDAATHQVECASGLDVLWNRRDRTRGELQPEIEVVTPPSTTSVDTSTNTGR